MSKDTLDFKKTALAETFDDQVATRPLASTALYLRDVRRDDAYRKFFTSVASLIRDLFRQDAEINAVEDPVLHTIMKNSDDCLTITYATLDALETTSDGEIIPSAVHADSDRVFNLLFNTLRHIADDSGEPALTKPASGIYEIKIRDTGALLSLLHAYVAAKEIDTPDDQAALHCPAIQGGLQHDTSAEDPLRYLPMRTYLSPRQAEITEEDLISACFTPISLKYLHALLEVAGTPAGREVQHSEPLAAFRLH